MTNNNITWIKQDNTHDDYIKLSLMSSCGRLMIIQDEHLNFLIYKIDENKDKNVVKRFSKSENKNVSQVKEIALHFLS